MAADYMLRQPGLTLLNYSTCFDGWWYSCKHCQVEDSSAPENTLRMEWTYPAA